MDYLKGIDTTKEAILYMSGRSENCTIPIALREHFDALDCLMEIDRDTVRLKYNHISLPSDGTYGVS